MRSFKEELPSGASRRSFKEKLPGGAFRRSFNEELQGELTGRAFIRSLQEELPEEVAGGASKSSIWASFPINWRVRKGQKTTLSD